MVRFENVFMRYDGGPVILRDVSFDLEPGSFHFLTGASGAGKSTLLRLMYLAARPVSGQVSMFGRDIAKVTRKERPSFRRRIGVVFQDFRLLPHLSALDNVALPLRIAGTREALIREHVPELLAWVGLSGHLDALPATLSGGQQQRIAIARAVIGRPSLLLADEPTGNVDDRIAVRLLYLFEELHKMGTTVIIATHNESLVDRFDHPRLHLEDARITRRAPSSLLRRPPPRATTASAGAAAPRPPAADPR
ncbi:MULTISPECIES: cell division ATP-binding protein FtsE [Thalassobaculum]|uniref:Cell division ATP-binding protein FtsE n=1 Tax=Thalassobaculum litoreum DSM 18839 TaxID=1123362 RepID=A0A8G2EVM4_9PROT|nr:MULTISPECIES: cell division ATP-binding protein FtsE [Thalassobaculum]SDF37764.1 cell division transport system ATP-binding protein [Thalassobaculum litoreum DSM 18839]